MSDKKSKNGTKWVVYTMDEDCKPAHFLAVEDSAEAAGAAMDKWWKAFRNGEKAKPKNYNGISQRPVSQFDRWKHPDE